MSNRSGPYNATHATTARGQKLRLSCDSCKAAKIKCGQERPACRRCLDHGIPCQYSPSRRMGRPRTAKKQNQKQPNASSSKEGHRASPMPSESSECGHLEIPSPPATSASTFPQMAPSELNELEMPTLAAGEVPTTAPGCGSELPSSMLAGPDVSLWPQNEALNAPLFGFDDTSCSIWTDGSSTDFTTLPFPLAAPYAPDCTMTDSPQHTFKCDSLYDMDTSKCESPATWIQRIAKEQKSLAQLTNEYQEKGCRLGPILQSCEKLQSELSLNCSTDKSANKVSTALAECHTIRVIAHALANGLARCCDTRTTSAASPSGLPSPASEQPHHHHQQQVLRLGRYQVQVTRENELVRALVRRRVERLQARLEKMADGSLPRSPRQDIRRCILTELKADVGTISVQV